MVALASERKPAMEKFITVRSSRRDVPLLGPTLRGARMGLRAWMRKRHTAKVLAELSLEQIRDCGIESPQLNVPVIEVPRGLMQRLVSAR